MAASIQERLKLKQYQVDTWTTREQLCLASAVMRSGDQNWVAVRRNIKMLTNETSRPPDWYSTKNCALQYARLLERVDTPKRKRERGDGGNETPGEIVTRMLSKQRIEELQVLEAEERATYSQLRREIQQLEAGKLDHQLDTFWEQLVKEQAEEEEREQRQQQWLKEREEKITAIQQALKHQGPKVPQPPHKKKPKLQVGGCVGMAESRRSSGLSETSSEVDSAAESPDLNEVTSESLVSNKSQDESGLVESEPKPTPTSPLLSSLLSKSPITGVPGAASSPLAQLGIGGRTVRGPVSEALQQLVSTRILGTNTVDKDKATHTTSGTGTSTLSRLLDLPPSTPGGPLPRLSDLPGPSYEQKEQLTAPLKECEKNEDNCCDKKSCDEQVTVEETKPSSHEKPTRNIAVTVGAPREAQKETERDPPVSQKEQRNVEESDEDKRDLHTSHRTCDKKEEGEKKESAELEQRVQKDQGKEEEKEDKEKLEKGTEKHEEEEKPEQKLEDKLQQEHKGIQQEVLDEMQDTPTKTKTTDEQTTAKEEPEVQKISNADIEHGKMQSEESVQEAESISKESGNGTKNEVPSLSQSCMAVTTMAETGQEDCKSTCMPEKEGCKPKMDCEVTEHQDKGLKREGNEEGHQGVEEEDNREDEVVAAAGVAEEEEEEEEERKEEEEEISAEVTTRTEMEEEEEEEDEEEEDDEEGDEEEDEDKPATELEGQVREDHIEGKKGEEGESRKTAEKEGETFGNLNQPEDRSISPVMVKDLKMAMGIKEQEDDYHDGQDSKDWVSEEEGSIFGGRKRKISGGDIISSSSPLISYSSPNSPASTHYGDDSENEKAYRSWKKPIMILWNDIAAHKFASLFLRPITDDQAPGYHSVVYRPMDLQKIKRNIESGVIRTTAEFQRDIMLMFLNATMYNTHDHNVYHMAHHMMKDAVSTIQDFLTTQMLVRAEDTPQKSLRRETRESSAKRSDDDSKRKRDSSDEKNLKKRRLN